MPGLHASGTGLHDLVGIVLPLLAMALVAILLARHR
jgi:hypothetical protein